MLRAAARPLRAAAATAKTKLAAVDKSFPAAAAASKNTTASSSTSTANNNNNNNNNNKNNNVVDCPRVMVEFGYREVQSFISHPGVMFVSKLIDMPHVARPKARLTEASVQAIAEFDAALGRKAKMALDNNVPVISFFDLDEIDQPGAVEQLKLEQIQTAAAADAVMKLSKAESQASGSNVYVLPSSLKLDACFPGGGSGGGLLT